MGKTISIIMTSYNYAEYISEAIESVINQTYTDWELIIVDDASIDNSSEIIKYYAQKDNRIKPFFHTKNLGLATAIQTGLKNTKTEWVAFLESDDVFLPDSLKEKVNAIQTGADIIFTGVELFQNQEKIKEFQKYFNDLNKIIARLDHSMFIENFNLIIPKINIIPTFSSVMLKRNILDNCNFNSICKSSLDCYLWSQLTEYKIYYLHKKLTKWRIHENSYITKDNNSWLIKYLFSVSLYYNTIKNKKWFYKIPLILNYMRARLLYIKLNKDCIKLNLFNNVIIFEKSLHK